MVPLPPRHAPGDGQLDETETRRGPGKTAAVADGAVDHHIIIVVSLVGQIALSVTTAATVGPRLARIEARIEVLER